jgi:hypothetical protein
MMKSYLFAALIAILCAIAPGGAALAKSGKAEAQILKVAEISHEQIKKAVQSEKARKQKGRIWCVPFARAVSGIEIRGDAKTWWSKASKQYAKGQKPVSGSILNFRSTRKMPLGHVAVVSKVINERQILVDQANWVRNKITQDVVIDVSKNNDWSAVRVANQVNSFGSVYPTFGFIYKASAGGA